MSALTLAHDNFENDTVGSIAPGWVNGTGANFVVTTNLPVSSSNALGEATYTNGHTAVYTGVAALADSCFQFSQIIQLDGSGHGANLSPSLRATADAPGALAYARGVVLPPGQLHDDLALALTLLQADPGDAAQLVGQMIAKYTK
jgi:hypothetical protein